MSSIVPFRATGPRSDRGKRIASVNALRHGLYASAVVVRGIEDPEEYQRFARQVVVELGVDGALDMALAERIISALWRLRRVRRYETEQLCEESDEAAALVQAAEEQEKIADECRTETAVLLCMAFDGYHVGSVAIEKLETLASALARVLGDEELYAGKLGILLERKKPVRLKTTRDAFEEAVHAQLRANGKDWKRDASLQDYALAVRDGVEKLGAGAAGKARELRTRARAKQTSALLLIDEPCDNRGRSIADVERRLERQLSRALDDFWKHRGYTAGALSELRRSGKSF